MVLVLCYTENQLYNMINQDDSKVSEPINQDKRGVDLLIENLTSHVDVLNKVSEQIKKQYFDYPIKQLMVFYQKELLPKLNNRAKTSHICSDILILYAYKMIGNFHLISNYIDKLDLKSSKELAIPQSPNISIRKSFTNVLSPNNTNTEIELVQPVENLETIIKTPCIFLGTTLISLVREGIQYCEHINDLKEKGSLELFIANFQKLIQQDSKSASELEELAKMSFFSDFSKPKSKVFVKFGYRCLFIMKLKTRVKKAEKRIKERKMRIQQLIDGEKKYIEGLKDYIQYIKKPIQATGLAPKEDEIKIFSTIEPILALHTHFHTQLNNLYANYSKYQIYGEVLSKNFPYFKIYTDYIYYADVAQSLLLKLADDNPEVQEICSKFMKEKQKKASDELKQPTFRIARYEMIIKEILKNTNPIHKDYEKLVQAQAVGVGMLRKINENVDAICRRNRLNQLEQQFGTEERPIFVDKREFLEEFQMFYIHEDRQESVTVLVFSDIVMVVQAEHRKVLKWIKIDENFYVRREEDNKTYKNIIKIHSDGFMTFSAGAEEKHINKAENFFNLLQRVSKESQQNNKIVYVQVIGTEEIGSTSFAKHTQYVIQIKYLGLRKLVHIRFSDMLPMVYQVQQHYKDSLNISNEQSLKKNWFNNHKSKTIEDRKRTIEQILQKIMNNELVRKDPVFMLELLKIDGNFFSKTQEYKKKRQSNSLTMNSSETNGMSSSIMKSDMHPSSDSLIRSLINNKPRKKEYKEAETILCATEIKLGRDLFHDIEEATLDLKKVQADKFDIKVYTTVEEEPQVVSINQNFTIEDICNKVSKIIGLRMNKDFRLFHEIGKKELRVLDQEQKIVKIFNFPKNDNKMGLVSDLVGSIKKILSPTQEPKLVYKKYYFLPNDIEQSECRKDLTRLRLIVYQIFSEIKQMKYQLSFDQYLLFLAMLIYIEFDGQIPETINDNFVDRLIPETIFKLKNYTEQQWIEKCMSHINRLSEEINKIIAHNTEQLKLKKIKTDSISKTALHFGKRHLCSQIVLNKIKTNPIFGSNLFYVQPYKKTFDKLANEGKKMAYNMWLAIKVEGLNLLTPSSKETVFELKYKDIEKIFVFSESITFKMDGLSTCEYRLNTYQSFEISQLVKYNKCLNDTLMELERNEDLILKARMYKQQCLVYRNSVNPDVIQQEELPA